MTTPLSGPDVRAAFSDVVGVRIVASDDPTPPAVASNEHAARLVRRCDLARTLLEHGAGHLDALDRVRLPTGETIAARDVTLAQLLARRPRTVRILDLERDGT